MFVFRFLYHLRLARGELVDAGRTIFMIRPRLLWLHNHGVLVLILIDNSLVWWHSGSWLRGDRESALVRGTSAPHMFTLCPLWTSAVYINISLTRNALAVALALALADA